ncbi:Wall-associated receptor kinase-like 2 [Citrus sinensis]|uniref:Wall-associated receptor kinase-like 2 n=1 Tax=Citrus sinensis TaxID=2711 RepID=A0ACB8M2X7_CITSI|nr:Wall-associated receptor kinase-like 2 [Citrus sinensis]
MAVHLSLVLLQIIVLHLRPIKASERFPCPTECGNVSISYPFGIGNRCYFDKGYEVICDYSSGSPKAFLPGVNRLELVDILSNDSKAAVRVNVPAISLNGSSKRTSNIAKGVNLSGTRFAFSTDNKFAAVGCSMRYHQGNGSSVFVGCLSIYTCDPTLYPASACYDFLCPLPRNVTHLWNVNTSYLFFQSIPQKCQSVFLVDEDWVNSKYLGDPHDLKDQHEFPAALKWGEQKGSCLTQLRLGQQQVPWRSSYSIFCNSDKTGCLTQLSSGHLCLCSDTYYYLPKGYCSGYLICNISSGYNCSNCPDGYKRLSDGCIQVFNKSRVKFIIIGCGGGLALFFLLIGIWWLYKFVKRRREIKLKHKFFKKNGGLLLQQELSSNEGNIEKMKLFTSKDLETATDNYNANRILGQGGQGIVYKGMLADGGIVAIKKSKILDESNLEQFINEVVILSQINHRNVVKLLGCCLETEVPLLVYEFILNGSLDQYIHYESEEFPITWEMRLRIAVEVSGALSYLHSAASIPIYHRDIKSANILLDDKYRAKVSDFGASRSITIDQTHLTTQVQGSFGYLDPEYFRSSHFTDKSDVYSFGVVLVELLTGQKPIRSTVAEEDKSLARYFILAMKENRLFEVLDDRVLKEAEKEEIITVATLAKRCLNLNGKKRPTMKEVAFELRGIRESIGASILQQNCEETDFVDGDITGHDFERDSSSSGSTLNSVSVSVDADPLISNKW